MTEGDIYSKYNFNSSRNYKFNIIINKKKSIRKITKHNKIAEKYTLLT